MPGGSPYEAYTAFIDPLSDALACIANAKICVSPQGKHVLDEDHSWTLNRGNGADLSDGFTLEARMMYRIIRDDREGMGPYRVTTRAYDYALYNSDRAEALAVHWHPESLVTVPHIHFGAPVLRPGGLLGDKHHLPTARMTFEQTIRWMIELGVKPICDDWEARLALSEAPHLLNRTWRDEPPPGPRDDVGPDQPAAGS